jgi:hypothetical protein
MGKNELDFPKEKGYQAYSAVYVPSTKNKNQPIRPSEHEKRAREVANFMTREFGGSTSVKGKGQYTESEGKHKGRIDRENVIIVENFSDYSDYKKKDEKVKAFLEQKAKEWGQESVAFEFEAPDKARRSVLVFPSKDKRKMRDVS